jgi:hypothetical protein
MQNSQTKSRLYLHFGNEKIHTAVPSPRNFSGNDPLLNILSRWFTALIPLRGTKINAGLPLKTGCLRVRNFRSHSTSRQITLRNQNKRKISYRKVEEEAQRIKRHVCFFILLNIKYVFICPSCCIDIVPARRRTYVSYCSQFVSLVSKESKVRACSYGVSCTCTGSYMVWVLGI